MDYYETDFGFAYGKQDANPLGRVEIHLNDAGNLVIDHTEVDPSLRGEGRARALVMLVVARARKEGRLIVPKCPYAARVLSGEPELRSLIAPL
ncbi:MAG: GNAT family N-acetyltransferase [Sphaerochaeta sp.]|jgi:predicted GNAT family acetyltransferase